MPARLPRLASASPAVFVSATAWTVWNQSTVNEKVYTVSLLSIALVTGSPCAEQPARGEQRWLAGGGDLPDRLLVDQPPDGHPQLPVVGLYLALTKLSPRVMADGGGGRGRCLAQLHLPASCAPPHIHRSTKGSRSASSPRSRGCPQPGPVRQAAAGQPQAHLGARFHVLAVLRWQWARDIGWLRGIATGLFTASHSAA